MTSKALDGRNFLHSPVLGDAGAWRPAWLFGTGAIVQLQSAGVELRLKVTKEGCEYVSKDSTRQIKGPHDSLARLV